mmetsp:Transcript_19115/g.57032  ORF Transcript_19115/g.57032 Transcript_19115/m.57032 type:complete len:299 (+) Transcript_19115:130-1026(+)
MISLARLTAQPPWGPLTPLAQRTGLGRHSAIHPPVDELRRAEGHHLLVAEGEGVGHLPRLSAQRHHLVVGGHAVEGGAVQRAESLEVLEGTRLLERLRIQLESRVGVEDARASAPRLLAADRVRRRVRAEEEARAPRPQGVEQRSPVLLRLEDGEAVEMGPYPSGEQRIPVGEQVLRGDGAREVRAAVQYRLDRLLGREVLEHDLEARRHGDQLRQPRAHKHSLAIKDVDCRVRHLAMDAEHEAVRCHRAEGGLDLGVVGHARVRVGRRAGRVQLERLDEAACRRRLDRCHRGRVGEV